MTELAAVNCGPGTDGAGAGPVTMSARRALAAGDPPTGATPWRGAISEDTEGEPAPQSGSPSGYRLWVNERRTVLVRLWETGVVEFAGRHDPNATWGPPELLAEEYVF